MALPQDVVNTKLAALRGVMKHSAGDRACHSNALDAVEWRTTEGLVQI